ncbi:putative ATP-dependent RNA helicase DDX28 [Poecilia latipinna]|uniref:DEAD (Asp-Glu-Ala-Asp) box polypeptide 28 n=1 Tax=Poecilia latipinna TaxID=48699 RepID=A0A3B3UIY4_9TELE|nr:PREDICTED: probable ATP-dependent RNA helicase DDX28 [Poecilia latipinna]
MQTLKVAQVASAALKSLGSGRLFRSELLTASLSHHFSATQTRFCKTEPNPEDTVVIRVPRYLLKRVENVKQARGKPKISTVKAGKLLIQSRNPSLNQSAGFTAGKFEQPVLCSKGWKHNKSFGDYFTINNIKEVAPFIAASQSGDTEQKSPPTFQNLHICEELVETLERVEITHPTVVQLQTIPKVMRGHNILCAAETGSGKTLSYLLPVVHRLQANRQDETTDRIRALVVVPSRELAEQVAAVSRTLCAPLGLSTSTVGGGRGVGHIKAVFRRNHPDILVATPGALVKGLRRNCLDLSELNFLVVDEADTMFDLSFSDLLSEILSHASIANDPKETRGLGHKTQLLLIGATFPDGVGEVLSKVTDLGKIVTVKSKMLHHLMPHVKQTFLKVKGADKVLELYQYLNKLQHEKGGGAALVFCNKSSTVNFLGYSLEEMKVKHARLQGEMPAVVRTGIFHSFQKGTVNVLICTDIASRGLDTSRVHLVVNYDFPESHTDYIHRAGRVGRAGGVEDGEVLSFVTHPWDVELVQNIETAARRKTSLPGMKSEIQEPKAKVENTEQMIHVLGDN